MAKRYTRINWQNAPSTATPRNAENLNIMDKGIKDCDDAIGDLALLTTNNKTDLVSAINEQNDNLANKLDSSSYAGSYNSVGWYRVAEYPTTVISSARGADCNSVNISIKRNYNKDNNEYYSLLLMSIYNKSEFIKIGKLSNTQRITKIRHTVDTINLKAYLEIYYSSSLFNNITINLFDVKDGTGGNKWHTITPVATSETVSGVEVFSTMDLTTA